MDGVVFFVAFPIPFFPKTIINYNFLKNLSFNLRMSHPKAAALAFAIADLCESIQEQTEESHQRFLSMSETPLTEYSEPPRKKYSFHSRRILRASMRLTDESFR